MKNIIVFFFSACLLNCALAYGNEIQKESVFAGQWPYHPTKAMSIDSVRNLLFLGNADTLSILDTDLNLISMLRITQSGLITGIFYSIEDMLIFASCKNDGLRIIDAADPLNPAEISAFSLENDAVDMYSVFISGNYAYIACGLPGVIAVDVSDLRNPVLASALQLPGAFGISFALDAYASAGYMWAADLYNGIHIINVQDPYQIKYKTLIPAPGARDISVSGQYMYAALEGNGLQIIDISKPGEPESVSLFSAEGLEKTAKLKNNLAYVAYGPNGIRVIDVSDKSKPAGDPDWVFADSSANSLALEDNALFATTDESGLIKLDISDNSGIFQIGSYDTPGDFNAFDIAGDYIYSVDDSAGDEPSAEGLRIFKISVINDAVLMDLSGFCPTPGRAADVHVSGGFAFIADDREGLQIIDISDKKNPKIAGAIDTPGTASGVWVSGDYAFVADGISGLTIIDIGNKGLPEYMTSINIPGTANAVTVTGNYAYIAAGEQGLQIVDVSNKMDPAIVGTVNTSGKSSGLFISGPYAYIADGVGGLSIIDVTDKTNPLQVSAYPTRGIALNVSVSGNFAYIADRKNGMTVVDVSNPESPMEEKGWSFRTSGIASDVYSGYTVGDHLFAFIADGPAGITAVNLKYEEDGAVTPDSGGSGGCFIESLCR